MEVFSSIAAKVREMLVESIVKEICYPFKYKTNMEELKKQVEKLTDRRRMVQRSVDEAKRQGEEIEQFVEEWMKSVDEFVEEVGKLIEDEDNAGEFSLMMRYSLSKKAEKTATDGISLLGEGIFQKVSYRPAIRRTKSVYARGYEYFDSRMPVFKELMEAVAGEDVNSIGVWGMGGVGKTTLVNRVVAQAIEYNLFEVVVMAEVTQTPDIKSLQGDIADGLGLKFDKEGVPGRADQLRERLKNETSILLILDNIWEKLDLDAVGIPFWSNEKRGVTQEVDQGGRNANGRKWKLLLTSRYLDVLRNDMETQKNFKVDTLSNVEAESLFWKIVNHSKEEANFKDIAIEIVRKCAGLPIAITTIATALKNKDLSYWNNALRWLRRSDLRSIRGMEASVYATIELSYNSLGSEEQSLFLLCSLFRSSVLDLSISRLLKHCMGLGLFKDIDTMEDARDRMHTLVGNLKASSLLLDGNAKGCIKWHDIIHAVAYSIASSKDKLMFTIQNVGSLKGMMEENLPISMLVSVPCLDITELPERLEFPKLKFLYLFSDKVSSQIPDAFFDGIKELKVLDLSHIDLSPVPSSLRLVTNLQTLSFHQCRIRDIAILGELKALEILSFLDSEIEQIPGEIRQLTRLRLLDLNNCSKLELITPNVLSCLTRLEELYMGNSFVQWDVEGQSNASLAELKKLSNLTTLELHVLEAQIIPHDLFFRKLERYKIFIGDLDVWKWSNDFEIILPKDFETLRILKLKLDNSLYLSDGIKSLLNKAEDLYLDVPQNVLQELHGEGFQQLKRLHVQNAPQIRYIINSVGWGLCNVFHHKLESLVLYNLVNLENIYHGQLTIESFCQLKVIKVGKCDKLKHLTLPMPGNFLQLQEIEVAHCNKLEEIVFVETRQVHTGEQINKIEFTQLHTITLRCLPRLTRFGFNALTSNMGFQEIFAESDLESFIQNALLPRLENLTLSSIKIEHAWFNQLPSMSSYCRTLVKLSVEEFGGLKFLFLDSTVKGLVQLQELVVRNCKSMEAIINTEEIAEEERLVKMTFPKLIWLELIGLPKLTRFGSEKLLEFPSLRTFYLEDCPKVRTFFFGSTSESITLNKKQKEMNSCNDVYHLLDKQVSLPSLYTLSLESLSSEVLWNNQSLATSSYLHNLTVLLIHNLCNLKFLFSPSMVKSLVQLKELEIINCKCMEVVVVIEEERPSVVLFPNLVKLNLRDLPKLTRFCNLTGILDMSSLLQLWIKDCPNMETFISDSVCVKLIASMECSGKNSKENLRTNIIQPFSDEKALLLRLENLTLSSIKIEHAWLGQLPSMSSCCRTLVKLYVEEFRGLKFLFLDSMVNGLMQLRELVVRDCKSMEAIINTEEIAGEERLVKMTFPKLILLQLIGLPKLTRFGSGKLLEFPSLRTFYLEDCPKVRMFFFGSTSESITLNQKQKEMNSCNDVYHLLDKQVLLPSLYTLSLESLSSEVIWNNQSLATSSYLHNLTVLLIHNLCNLKFLFSPSMIKSLVQLKELEIINCKCMEVVAVIEEKRPSVVSFPNLLKLILHDLPKLTRFCNLTRILDMSSLLQLWIKDCPNMETFISDSVCANLTASMKCNGKNSKKNLRANIIQPFFDEKVQFSSLTILKIVQLDNLRKVWHNQFYSNSFCKLELFHVYGCNKLFNVFPSDMLGRLQKLDELVITKCDSVEEIFELKALGSKKTHDIAAAQLKTLWLHNLPKLKQVWNMDSQVILSSQNLHLLSVRNCDSLKSLFPAIIARGLEQLEKLDVHNCMMEEIIAKEDEVQAVPDFVFPQLIQLELLNLPRLKSFHLGLYISKWPMLKRLLVWRCNEVEMLASEFQSQEESQHDIPSGQPLFLVDKIAFPSLNQLELNWNCLVNEMSYGKFSEYSCNLNGLELSGPFMDSVICPSCFLCKLPKVTSLAIYNGCLKELFLCEWRVCKEIHFELPSGLSFLLHTLSDSLLWKTYSEFDKVAQNLATLQVLYCQNISSLVPSTMSFKNLTTLEVSNCGELLNLVAFPTAKSLVQLTRLEITECKKIEEIITHREDEAEGSIIFNQLKYLGLNHLPSLTIFYSGSCTIEFPSLQEVVVKQCPNMKIFSRGHLSTPRLHTLQMAETEKGGRWEGDLNTTIAQNQYIEKNGQCAKEG